MSKIIGGKASIQVEDNKVVVWARKWDRKSGTLATHTRIFSYDREGCRAALRFCGSHNLEVTAA